MKEMNFKFVTAFFEDNSEMDNLINAYFPNCYFNINDKTHEILYLGNLAKAPHIPNTAKSQNSLLNKYYVWNEDSVRWALSVPNKLYDQHLVINTNGNIAVFTIGNNMDEGIWALRIFREVILLHAMLDGFVPMHASAVVDDMGNATVFFGNKGSGKSTSMFSHILRGFQPLSNDLVLIGKIDGVWKCIGWPWRVTLGNDLLNKVDKSLVNKAFPKTAFTPKEFSEQFNVSWRWEANVKKIVHPQIDLNTKMNSEKVKNKSQIYKTLLKEGTEFKDFNDTFNILTSDITPSFENIFSELAEEVDFYFAKGNIFNSIVKDGIKIEGKS